VKTEHYKAIQTLAITGAIMAFDLYLAPVVYRKLFNIAPRAGALCECETCTLRRARQTSFGAVPIRQLRLLGTGE